MLRSMRIVSLFYLKLLFVWPFKFIVWCFKKLFGVDKRYDVDFSDYPDADFLDDEEYYMVYDLVDRAIVFATNAHEGQTRKGTQIPYILHPLEAMSIVGTMTTDVEVLAAAVLHDVVEDTDYTVWQIEDLFGERVAELVANESENKRENLAAEDTWKIRKQETLEHLKNAPIDVLMITLGDKLSNIRAIYRDYQTHGEELWQRFNNKNKADHFWYYKGVAKCLYKLKDHQAYKEYCDLVKKTFLN